MTASHTRIDRRQAILEGAFAVFARQGYAQSCVQEIADEAGVAKPTVYNHFSDKAALFREALRAVARSTLTEMLAVVEPLVEPDEDLRFTLEGIGHDLVRLHCDDRAWALRRLLSSEVTRLPGILDILKEYGPHRLNHALAGALARLMVAGRLRSGDPSEAAEHFIALLTGPAEAHALMGTRRIEDAEARDLACAAVRTFLHAMEACPTEE